MRRTPRLVAPTLLAALVLTGCLPSSPAPPPPATTDAEPVFASEDEALAAAEEAYARYISVVDSILADGGKDPERLAPLVSEEVYTRELGGFESFTSNGWHGLGATEFELSLQQFSDVEVWAYVCEDISGTDVVNSSGVSVVQAGRPTLFAFEVRFLVLDGLVLDAKDPWNGGGVCAG